jgi:nicotinamidase-related amidase
MKKICLWVTLFIVVSVLIWGGFGAEDKAEKGKMTKRMKPVLLVIDIQNAYLPMMDKSEKDFALEMINYAIEMFRAKGFLIIRVYHTDLEYGPKPDSDSFQFPKSVKIKPDDPKIIKNYSNAFKKTNLEKMLCDKGYNTVFLCGLSSVGCVIATYFGAMDRDFDAFLLKDTLISHNSKYTKSIEEIFNALGYNALKVMLENAQNK